MIKTEKYIVGEEKNEVYRALYDAKHNRAYSVIKIKG